MLGNVDLSITPEPSDEDREAVLAAVRELLQREEAIARPAAWALAGRTQRRVGISDLRGGIPSHRAWPLSVWLPAGGRTFPGLNGRGDAK